KPVEKMKKEELKALNALKFLADIIVFIVDVAESCGFTIEQQYSLFKSLAKYIERGDKIIVLNKIDLAKEDQIMKAKEIFGEDVLQTSLLKKVGVKEVVDRLLSLSKTYTIN
ncbi:MAG: GTP1/OBG family GTP-binding protein, partial [Candidatus Methanomethylicota archaeon]